MCFLPFLCIAISFRHGIPIECQCGECDVEVTGFARSSSAHGHDWSKDDMYGIHLAATCPPRNDWTAALGARGFPDQLTPK